MAQLNDLLVMGQSTLLGPVNINDTLYLNKITDADSATDKRPALIIGNLNGEHLEMDGNEIMAKSNATTPGQLNLNTGSTSKLYLTDACVAQANESITVTGTNKLAAERNSLLIYGQTYGNDDEYGNPSPHTKLRGQLSYGDPGPQIIFGTSNNLANAQKAALIFTDHDKVSAGCSLSLVSTETNVSFITQHLKAYGNIQLASDSSNIIKTGKSCSWYQGRYYAAVVMDSINGYSPFLSTKSSNGSWDMGCYHSNGFYDELVFTYVPDQCCTASTPGNSVTVSGTTYSTYNAMRITKNGQVKATTFNASSDQRLKKNITVFTPTKSILDLPIYKFDFINNNLTNQIGCMAQDLREICPEIVNENNDGYLSIQESKIVYLLIDEIKKLKEEITMLKQHSYKGDDV